jgi:hypothetical protein
MKNDYRIQLNKMTKDQLIKFVDRELDYLLGDCGISETNSYTSHLTKHVYGKNLLKKKFNYEVV